MNGIPIIRIEIDGMKETISHAMMSRSKEFDTMVNSALDKIMNIETLQHKIDMQVAKALDNAIDSLSENHHVKSIVQDIVRASLSRKRDELETEAFYNGPLGAAYEVDGEQT